MNAANKAAIIVSKIIEVFHWVGAALLAAATVCAKAAPDKIGLFVGFDAKECCGAELNVYGFEVQAAVVNGSVDMTAFFLFGIGGTLILLLMAMVFRNLHLILKASAAGSPFRADNIRMLKEIGIFSVAVPLVGFVMSIVIRLVLGPDAAEISVDQAGLFMGLIILCLTRYFMYGAQLEEEVDGLV
ncbi:MAG: hypothetical protein IKC76_05540 [Firmicutes bacterium]|nr:hypothetical protein [Bacillota bacterium]MBR7113963.1 hypothetical protein [Bacillota bacterium]